MNNQEKYEADVDSLSCPQQLVIPGSPMCIILYYRNEKWLRKGVH